ncbi:hypothetical protein C8Q80DRAFT_222920 [Daedaleopsis nitida]|nr:hypothetical protein C8Q80DRAFT_222920 [Daedaleopsis nitida]
MQTYRPRRALASGFCSSSMKPEPCTGGLVSYYCQGRRSVIRLPVGTKWLKDEPRRPVPSSTPTKHSEVEQTIAPSHLLAFSSTMKFALPSFLTVALLAAPALVAADNWTCNSSWNDGGLRRLSFNFQGYCENRWGQCFLDALRGRALTVHNWQAWDRGDGWWQVDFSTTAGLAWQANNAIQDVTHVARGCWANQ